MHRSARQDTKSSVTGAVRKPKKTPTLTIDGVGQQRGGPDKNRWRFWLGLVLVLVFVGLGGFGGAYVHKNLPPKYRASTTILVLPTAAGLDSSVGGSRSAAEVQIETEAELLRSSQVASAASVRMHGALSAKVLLKNSSVTVPPNSQVLAVSLVAGTPRNARDGAAALANAYLERRDSQATDEVASVVKTLEAQESDLSQRLEKTAAALAVVDPKNQGQRELIASQRALLVDQLADVNSRLVSLRIDTSRAGEIVTKAELPDHSVSPSLPLTVGAGAMIGLLVAGGLLLALNQMRTKRRTASASPAPRRVPVLATLALNRASVSDGPDAVHFVDEEEVMRRLCMKIATHKGIAGPTVIVGVGDPDLRTRVGTRMNQAWAREFGRSVLVVTEPGDHVRATGVVAAMGLRDALRKDRGILDTAIVPNGTNAALVGPGRDAELAPTAAQRGLLPEIWAILESQFGSVLVQTGSPLDSPLAQSVAQTAGRFVVVVEVGIGQRRDLTSTLEEIEWLDLSNRVAGVVIVSNHPAPPLGDDALHVEAAPPIGHGPDVSGAFHER